MATVDLQNALPRARGEIQSPVTPLIVGNNGSFRAKRATPAQGSCGTHGYPCEHPGVDANGSPGQPVKAPEGGVVVTIADGNSSPFVGYGPWVVIIRGDTSGRYQFFAHLDPATAGMATLGQRVEAGQQIGTISSANHTHWELRKKPVPNFAAGETNFTNNEDPVAWLHSQQGGALGQLVLIGAAAVGVAVWWRRRR